MKVPRIKILHFLLTVKRDDDVVAHCLDLDLVATGKNQEQAKRRLIAIVKAQLEFALARADYEVLCSPAPDKYWKVLAKSKYMGETIVPITIPDIVPMEHRESNLPMLEFVRAACSGLEAPAGPRGQRLVKACSFLWASRKSSSEQML